jgi:hypothetical protein
MRPVSIISIPDNKRDPLYPEDTDWRDADGEPAHAVPRLAPYVDLPIPMPESIIVITDSAGQPLAISADGQRIRKHDVMMVWQGVLEYNADCSARQDGDSQ